MAAGEESPQQPPEEVTAEAVQPETVQPTEVKPEEVQPAEAEAVQPTETEVQPTEMAEVVQPTEQPQVLATQAPAETTVVQPAETVQPVEPTPEVVTPVEKPKPVAKPKDVVKKSVPKVAKAKSGSKGESEQDSKRGSVEGTETAQSDTTSQVNARRTGSGNAAIANYRGKVEARLKRYMARLSSKHKQQGLTLVVSLVIGSGGELRSLSLARSSGDPELDQAAMEQIRRAAPFPALPPEWGKPTWPATQAIRIEGR
jgi:protein TonB